jgi:hypothetical protein
VLCSLGCIVGHWGTALVVLGVLFELLAIEYLIEQEDRSENCFGIAKSQHHKLDASELGYQERLELDH